MAGILVNFGFSPFNYPIFSIVGIIILYVLYLHQPRLNCALIGLCFGLGMFAFGTSWIYISIHEHGHIHMIYASLITCIFILYLSSYFMLHGLLVQKFSLQYSIQYILQFSMLWVILEWIRGWLFTGFPWLYIGHMQINTILRAFIPIIGSFATSCTFIMLIGLTLFIILNLKKMKVIIFPLTSIILVLSFAYLIIDKNWTNVDTKSPIKISIIQGNISQELKWDAAFIETSLNIYQNLTASHWDSQIIVWPENAIPLPKKYAASYIQELDDMAKTKHATIITGLPIEAEQDNYYNSIIALGQGTGEYYKKYLVPFGEYTPLKSIFTRLNNFLQIPMSSFIQGPHKQKNLIINNIIIAPFICYEIAYTSALLDFRKNAQLLVTISNDAWFGRSIAQAQHLQIARTQSLQTGKYQIMSTNDGISAIISPKGNIIKTIPPYREGTLTGIVYQSYGLTPWMYIGDNVFIIILIMLSLLCNHRFIIAKRRKVFTHS